MSNIKYNPDLSPAPIGLPNTGVICYFNSFLQSLISCSSFIEVLNNIKNPNPLCILLKRLSAGESVSLEIFKTFKSKVGNKFANGQEDTNELFIQFMDVLACPELDMLFESRFRTLLKCENCGYSKMASQPDENIFIDLSRENITNFVQNLRFSSQHLEDYRCEKCNKCHVKAYRKMTLTPECLVIVLKKYKEKWSADIPTEFNIDKYKYRLIATNDHSGGMSGGHYWARILRKNKYFVANDSNITKLESLTPVKESYVLWYHYIE